ncbi:RNA-directed DNA polymerase, eukaryota [Tanacetum coccineum]|uniref:RNA-directed DNA polymerase, eukaryota n=1 Tax=Tanacetum coccineum TaxID=301880 RepID=A0ABQ5B3Q0_9ASTR
MYGTFLRYDLLRWKDGTCGSVPGPPVEGGSKVVTSLAVLNEEVCYYSVFVSLSSAFPSGDSVWVLFSGGGRKLRPPVEESADRIRAPVKLHGYTQDGFVSWTCKENGDGRSKADDVSKIAKSVFVTNFPESSSVRDLWKACSVYGTVVDVFIPSKKSKAGKRFAFVRFIKVFNLDRLVENLCTIWIGRYHLYANQVRFERPHKSNSVPTKAANVGVSNRTTNPSVPQHSNGRANSYANAVNGASSGIHEPQISTSPALVLDDTCLIERDLSKHLMGKVKDFSVIPNLYMILKDEGFLDVKLSYLGGTWVLIEFDKMVTKEKFMNHTGINSWFQVIQDANTDFVSEERIVWMDIEGVPLNAWSRETFVKIGKKWGDTLDLEDNVDNSFGRKRICVKTKYPVSILETFKIIVKGRVFMVRAKELFTWNPSFVEHKEKDYASDNESDQVSENNAFYQHPNEEEFGGECESDEDGVPETVFGSNVTSPNQVNGGKENTYSEDPFGIYNLLENKNRNANRETTPSLSHPPGFTPEVLEKQGEVGTQLEDLDNNKDNEPSVTLSAKVMNVCQDSPVEIQSDSVSSKVVHNGGSVLDVMEDIIRIGQTMGYSMEGSVKDLASLGHKTKKEWIKALVNSHKLNFLAIQETKMGRVSHMDVKFLWGNSNYDFVCCDSLGNSGGILCIWEASIFKKDKVTISDNFIAIYGTWLPCNTKILFVNVYAPQQVSVKRILWDYISTIIGRWNGESIVMGDFNEVRTSDERRGSCFNPYGAKYFDRFISYSGLVDIALDGYAFTWSHPSASKMSKLDRFLVSDGIFSLFPTIAGLCLDRHLSDHRPILLREAHLDFGPTPFRFYHSWFDFVGFDDLIKTSWLSFSYSNTDGMTRFKKKLQDLKVIIRRWVKIKTLELSSSKKEIISELENIDKAMDRGVVDEASVLRRLDLKHNLLKITEKENKNRFQKSKVKWAVEGDENSKFFHGIINKRRSQLAIRGIFVDGVWQADPASIKKAFFDHFEARFTEPAAQRFKINFQFHKKLLQCQADDLERGVTHDEIREAVWNCGDNKSPGPDGYTFEFFKKYWDLIGLDFCEAVVHFFVNGGFSKGCNSSFITLIPKVIDAKFVNDFRPISLIGCIYKVVTKVLANRLVSVIGDLVSDTQSAFIAGRQILDGPFILDEILNWCRRKKNQVMFFKVDFAKAYDSVRWDYLLDVLEAFGFGHIWCNWIRGILYSNKASILINGSPSKEFSCYRGLKQGDPLAPYLFILIMESLHLSFNRVVDEGLFKGVQLPGSISLSHLFYADDAMFIGEWSDENLKVGIPSSVINQAASYIGCSILNNKFRYLGVLVGDCSSRIKAWDDVILKLKSRLSKWKVKTLIDR